MTSQDSVPTAVPDMDFLRAAHERFSAIFRAVAAGNHKQATANRESALASSRVRTWLFNRVAQQPKHWEANHRVITALLEGVEDSSIALRSYGDTILFSSACSAQLHLFPSLAEHFISTEELMGVLRGVYASDPGLIGGGLGTPSTVALRIKMLRLYSYDIIELNSIGNADSGCSATDALGADTTDDESFGDADIGIKQLFLQPLGVRMSLSGFHDHITARELTWDTTVCSSAQWIDSTEAQRLESFGELNAKRRGV